MGHQHLSARHSVDGPHRRDHAGRARDHRRPWRAGHEIEGDIEFRKLNFSYDGKQIQDKHVLHDLNLRVPAGTSLAIVGPTGSGKSTLVSLIARIYDADPGTVLIDGRPIAESSVASCASSIGFVPQETFLFSETHSREHCLRR